MFNSKFFYFIFLQFLQNIGSGVVNIDQMMNTVIEELRLMKMCLESGKGPATKPKQITQSELTDHTIADDTDYHGTNRKIKIVRKCYKTTINVACIPIKINEITQEGYKQLAILSKLSECTNILKFYGLSNLDGVNHLVVEWAQYGTLRETYIFLGLENYISLLVYVEQLLSYILQKFIIVIYDARMLC
jgi:hypothetical protein